MGVVRGKGIGTRKASPSVSAMTFARPSPVRDDRIKEFFIQAARRRCGGWDGEEGEEKAQGFIQGTNSVLRTKQLLLPHL